MARQKALYIDSKFAMHRDQPCHSLSEFSCSDHERVALVKPLLAHEPQAFSESHAGETKRNEIEQPKIKKHKPGVFKLTVKRGEGDKDKNG